MGTPYLPSSKFFTECISSDTKQTSSLPRTTHKTHSKHETLGKSKVCRVPEAQLSAKQGFAECLSGATRQSAHVHHQAQRRPLVLWRVSVSDTRQRDTLQMYILPSASLWVPASRHPANLKKTHSILQTFSSTHILYVVLHVKIWYICRFVWYYLVIFYH